MKKEQNILETLNETINWRLQFKKHYELTCNSVRPDSVWFLSQWILQEVSISTIEQNSETDSALTLPDIIDFMNLPMCGSQELFPTLAVEQSSTRNEKGLIFYATYHKNQHLLNYFYSKAQSLGCKDDLLHWAVICNQSEIIIDELLLLGHDINRGMGKTHQFTPLCFAAFFHNLPMIKLLLNKGTDLNSMNAVNESAPPYAENLLPPIHIAAFLGDTNLVEYLLKNNGDFFIANGSFFLALIFIVKSDGINLMIKILDTLQHEKLLTINHFFIEICALGELKTAHALLEKFPVIVTTNNALHIAIYLQDEPEVVRLLKSGADVDAALPVFSTPLACALHIHSHKLLCLLLQHHALITAPIETGSYVFNAVRAACSPKILQTLIDHHADFEKRSPTGLTALGFAARANNRELVNILLFHARHLNLSDHIPSHLQSAGIPSDMLKMFNCEKEIRAAIYLIHVHSTPQLFSTAKLAKVEKKLTRAQVIDPDYFAYCMALETRQLIFPKQLLDRLLVCTADNNEPKLISK